MSGVAPGSPHEPLREGAPPHERWSIAGAVGAQRRFVYLVIALLCAGGILAALRLPSAIYPELQFPRIAIVAQGSALGARQVVFAITQPIEEAVGVVPGVTRVQSRSIRGASEISVTFAPNTDMAYALQQTQARINQLGSALPVGLEVQVERLSPSLFPVISYNLEGGAPATLYDIARYQIRPVLSRVPGVGRVEVQASDVREIEVIADPVRLAEQGLSYDDLATAIRTSTTVTAVGRVAQDYKQYLVVTAPLATSVEAISGVVIGRSGLRVREVATVEMGTEDHVRIVAGDGQPAALLNITRQVGGNTTAIADSVEQAAITLRKTLPRGVTLKPVYDQAQLVRDATRSVRDAMIIGAVLAVIILFLFLRKARITAISAASIPLTLAITVFIMSLVGQTFNLMTLGAMAIAIGIVIDDAVVISENIVRHLGFTPDRDRAIREAVQELIIPVTTSTITTVVVFLPLRLLEGVVGQFFAALSITLTIAVLVSLVLAVTIIPLLAEAFLTAEPADEDAAARVSPDGYPVKTGGRGKVRSILEGIGRAIDALSDRYQRSLAGVLHHTRLMIVGAVILMVGGYVAYRLVPTGFLPEIDEGAFVLDYFSPGGTALAETDRQVHIIESLLTDTTQFPEVAGISRRTGAELGLFATEQNRGDIVVRLTPQSDRHRTSKEVIEDVRRRVASAVPRLRVEFVQILGDVINDLAGAARPVEVKLFGSDLDALEHYAKSVEPAMAKLEGVEDFYNGVSETAPELTMTINGAEASRVGLTPDQVAASVTGALLGVSAGEVRLQDRSIGVRVRAPDAVRRDALRLGALPVVIPASHSTAPLAAMANFEPTEARSAFTRENQQQMITMTSDVTGSLGTVMSGVNAVLAKNPPPAGVRLEIAGQSAGQATAFKSLLTVLALAVAAVIGVMVLQFRSFVEPLVVLAAAPISFVGAMLLLLVTGTPLNVSSFMGLILLVGLIVKNGIILLDFTHHYMLAEDEPLEPALLEAGRVRLRPILMTTLCTLFGLLPLALGLGAGSDMQRPLAFAVIGGLALSTPITLYLVPTFLVAVRGRDYRLPSQPSARPRHANAGAEHVVSTSARLS